ncbi:hypothetical protein [Lentimicrobium saccharophilum]|nr:hypothetical protein [Lentimicrobium saccharophilum]
MDKGRRSWKCYSFTARGKPGAGFMACHGVLARKGLHTATGLPQKG